MEIQLPLFAAQFGVAERGARYVGAVLDSVQFSARNLQEAVAEAKRIALDPCYELANAVSVLDEAGAELCLFRINERAKPRRRSGSRDKAKSSRGGANRFRPTL